MSNPDLLTIVWQRSRNSVWEDEWIEYLFKDIPHRTIENLDHSQYVNNSVVVDALCWAPYHNDYIREMTARKYRFGLVHLTDEDGISDTSSYGQCRFVLRNYYRPGLGDHVLQVPLGWNTGFTQHQENPPVTNRSYTWSMVAHRWDQNRNDMVQHMSNFPGGKLYVVGHHGPRLSVPEMSKIYRDSIFVVCPNGAITPDSFRITEALEAGCIPVVQKNDLWFKSYGSDFPAVQINQWNELPNVLVNHLIRPKELEALRQHCYQWWTDTKEKTVKNVTDLVLNSMKP